MGSAYLLANAALIPLWASLAISSVEIACPCRRLGIFIRSLLCPASNTIIILIVGRAIKEPPLGKLSFW